VKSGMSLAPLKLSQHGTVYFPSVGLITSLSVDQTVLHNFRSVRLIVE